MFKTARTVQESHISVQVAQPVGLTPDSSGLQEVIIKAGGTQVEITFDQKVDIVSRENGVVAIHRGPLLYALDLEYTTQSFPPLQYRPVKPLTANQVRFL